MSDVVQVAILGGTGYGAGELLRLLTQHPAARVVCVTSESAVGESVAKVHPHLRGFYDLTLRAELDPALFDPAAKAVVFSTLPHGRSGQSIAELHARLAQTGNADHVRVIDLSGDFRLTDSALHKAHYPDSPEAPELRRRFVYGLPELNRPRIAEARLIANPGCLASASILALAPLTRLGLTGLVAIDANTGSSGAGRQLKETTHHPTRHADFRAYKALAHQHEPEILQALGDAHGEHIRANFVAHSMDVARGIFVTCHVLLAEPSDAARLRALYADFYRDSPFIRIVDDSPALQNVVGSNFCDLAVACRGRQVVVFAALDNLVKGMAGTAIQNLNLVCGLPETLGLWQPAMRPV